MKADIVRRVDLLTNCSYSFLSKKQYYVFISQEQFSVDYLKPSSYFSVNGDFTLWTPWSPCPDACGRTALRSRERYCTNPAPANGGKNCEGPRFQLKLCKIKQCAGLHSFSFVVVKVMCTSHQTKDGVIAYSYYNGIARHR